jgi:hypothetical protein
MSGEAGSRAYLDLPGNQQQLLEAVVAAGKPVVLLVFSGRPLVLDWAAQTCSRNHGGLVPRNRGRERHRQCFVRRCVAQRQAAHELPPRRRPGAALLQSVPHRTPAHGNRSVEAAGGRHPLLLPLHRCSQQRAVSLRLRTFLLQLLPTKDVKVSKSSIPLAQALSGQSRLSLKRQRL